MSFTYTLMKGKEHVLSEVNLMMICYNLKRITSILDTSVLKNRLKKIRLYNIKIKDAFLAFISHVIYFNNLNAFVILSFKTDDSSFVSSYICRKTEFVRRLPLCNIKPLRKILIIIILTFMNFNIYSQENKSIEGRFNSVSSFIDFGEELKNLNQVPENIKMNLELYLKVILGDWFEKVIFL